MRHRKPFLWAQMTLGIVLVASACGPSGSSQSGPLGFEERIAPPGSVSSDTDQECDSGEVCLHKHDALRGQVETLITEDRDLSDNCWKQGCGGSDVNDEVSSISNFTDRSVVFFEGKGFKGATLCVAPGGSIPNLHALPDNMGDKISSVAMGSQELMPTGFACDVSLESMVGGYQIVDN